MAGNHDNTTKQSVLHTQRSRRSFLRGAGIAAAGAAGLAAFGKLDSANAAGPVRLLHPPVEITKAEPVASSTYKAERVGARSSLVSDLWRPTGHVWLKNTSTQQVTLSGMRVSYVGAGAPGPLETLQMVDIPAGKTKVVPIAETRLHALPIAPVIRIECYFQGYTPPVTHLSFMNEYVNDEPGNAYDFPGKTADLPAGQYWYQGSNHGWDSNHGNTRSQRFAYDLGVVRYNGENWTSKRAPKYMGEVVDGSKNDHYNAWGTPVYAVRAGTTVRGYRLKLDNSVPGVKDSGGGGNCFWIQHEAGDEQTGGYMLYAHLQAGSVPEALVPVEGEGGISVQKGQFLGLVGNSGSSTGPHLHIHFQRGIDEPGESTNGEGMPLRFKNVRYREYDDFDPGAAHLFWNNNVSNATAPTKSLIDAVGPASGAVLNPSIGGGPGSVVFGN
ncbi:MAG: M23 family metallopeptidase [Tepidiformaceae bacterium]